MIQLPYKFTPRNYQIPFLRAMDNGYRRAVLVWHRRSGKDKTVFNYVVKEMFKRVGNYFYVFPTYAQGKKALWENKDKNGFPFLGHVPKEWVKDGVFNNTEMKFQLTNPYNKDEPGSLFQIIGAENIDSIMGTSPVGCVFSEYSIQDPSAWKYVSPAILESNGWAIFDYTPRGKNHGYDLYRMAEKNPDWYCQLQTVEDTWGNGGTMSPDMVRKEKEAGATENFIRQEYYCDFDAAVENSVFGDQIFVARKNNRFRNIPWDPKVPVETYWDIGWDDNTAIWFVQQVLHEVRLIDYYEARLAGPEHYVKVLREKPYTYGRHVMPHDADRGLMETGGKSLRQIMGELGVHVDIAQRLSKEEQIQHARLLFPRCYFDKELCSQGIDSLASWHFAFDDQKQTLGRTPVHDWSSHASDAYCLIGVELRPLGKSEKIKYPSYGYV